MKRKLLITLTLAAVCSIGWFCGMATEKRKTTAAWRSFTIGVSNAWIAGAANGAIFQRYNPELTNSWDLAEKVYLRTHNLE